MKKWKRYTLMHKNRKVAALRSDGSCTVYSKSFLPYNIYLEDAKDLDIDAKLNNLENFYHWCASRVLTLDRKYAKEIMNSIGQKQAITDRDRSEIAIAYHGLSLTDVYWIKGDREKITFEEINLYEHSLSNAFVDVSLKGKQLTLQNAELIDPSDIAGDVSTLGVAPKAWVRENNRFCLLKDGDKSEVESELLASKIARCFSVDQVLYEADYYQGEKVTKSEMVSSLDRGLVAIEHIDIYAQNHDSTAQDLVMKYDPYGYYMMNIVDYLVGNTDRHWGNWGFLIDNKTNKLIKLYPLMDFNKAFGSYDTIEGSICLTTENKLTQKDAAIQAVRTVGLNQIAVVMSDWFDNGLRWNMFKKRLEILREQVRCCDVKLKN